MNRLSPFFYRFKSYKVQSLKQGLAAWEHAALEAKLPVAGVQAFDRVCCVDDFLDIF